MVTRALFDVKNRNAQNVTKEDTLKRKDEEETTLFRGFSDANSRPARTQPIFRRLLDLNNPVVFFDISIKDTCVGRMIFELYSHKAPKTCENFRQFCIGTRSDVNNTLRGYKGSIIHRVVKKKLIQGGDFVSSDGYGCTSIYNQKKEFEDETFEVIHDSEGILGMANSGPHTNGCQFFVASCPLPSLNGKSVAFGCLREGFPVLREIESLPTHNEEPEVEVKIIESGEL